MKKHNFILIVSVVLGALTFNACQGNTPQNTQKQVTTAPVSATESTDTQNWATDIDVVCKMSVDQTVEDTVHYGGQIYGFCSSSCKEKFQESPTQYMVSK